MSKFGKAKSQDKHGSNQGPAVRSLSPQLVPKGGGGGKRLKGSASDDNPPTNKGPRVRGK